MKIFDFIDKLRTKQNPEKPKPQEKKKKDLGTCVPLHALTESERKKRLLEDDSLEKELKKKKKPVEEIDFVDKHFTRETRIKENDIDLPSFGTQRKEVKKVIQEKPKDLIELDESAHKRKALAQEEKEIEEQLTKITPAPRGNNVNLFRVTGLYDFGTTTMISGIVQRGNISAKMRAEKNGKEIEVTEIKMGPTKVRSLGTGEEGSLFVKTKGNLLVKYDDVLDFE